MQGLMSMPAMRNYGNLKDQDRIFTNLYDDGDRLSRELSSVETGIRPRTFSPTDLTGLWMKLRSQDLEAVVELVSPQVLSTPSCPRCPMADHLTWSSMLMNQSLEPARTEKLCVMIPTSW